MHTPNTKRGFERRMSFERIHLVAVYRLKVHLILSSQRTSVNTTHEGLGQWILPTCEARQTGAVEAVNSVLTRGTVEAGRGGTLVHLLLTVLPRPAVLTVARVVTDLRGGDGGLAGYGHGMVVLMQRLLLLKEGRTQDYYILLWLLLLLLLLLNERHDTSTTANATYEWNTHDYYD